MKTSVTAGRRAPRASVAKTLIVLCCATAGTLILLSHPAAAFYSEVKPSVKVGVDCVGKANQLAPKLTACTVAGTKMRIWCPNGQMFEGAAEQSSPAVALARSLCNMTQVP
jgi:hypothetical protein